LNPPALTLGCPRCGAPAFPEAVRCDHCGTPLALVACPACFARLFRGTRYCSHCGAEAARAEPVSARAARACPRCRQPLAPAAVGAATLDECARCGGVWADVEAFERILKDGEAQSVVLGAAADAPAAALPAAPQPYVPCPACGRLMNRLNFARCSGVLVDACKGHGTWFDRDELRGIVAFVRAGGLSRARQKEKDDLDEQRRRLREQELVTRQATSGSLSASSSSGTFDAVGVIDAADAVASAGRALWRWLRD
jgi:Zn-finger nucleic acid-binding protein